MMNKINVSQILSKNCGGYGAWMDNTLSSPAPGPGLWRGFQLGGGSDIVHRGYRGYRGYRGRSRCSRCSRKKHMSRKNNKRHQKKTMRKVKY